MSIFVYSAISREGRRVEGEIEARSRGEALQKLDLSSLQPIEVRPKEAMTLLPVDAEPGRRERASSSGPLVLTGKQIVQFTDEISDLLDAGLKLEPALRVMEQRRELSRLKDVVIGLRQQVRDGVSFSAALRSVSSSFDELYCRLVSAGEMSGALPQILRRQAAYLTTMNELRNRVVQALIYPAILSTVGLALIMVFMLFLVPQLTVLFSKTGTQLPLLTRGLIALSAFFGHWWWLLVFMVMAASLSFWRVIATPWGGLWWDRAKLKLPLAGAVISSRYYVQFSQTLATMVGNGIPLLNALRLMHAATSNRYLYGVLTKVVDSVSDGGAFSRALEKTGNFPPVMVDIVAIGEQTGDLSAALEKAGSRYDKELNLKIQRMTAIIQPAVVIVMALAVGVVAFSMITGIFQAVSGLKTR